MRQRRALLRPLRGRQAPDCQTQDQGGNQGRHHRAGHPPRWTDPRRHGPAAPGAGRDSVSGRTRSPELFARGGRAAGGIGRGIHGQPHAVLRVDSVERAPVHELGPKIEHHPRFPQRVNVGFLQVVDRRHARLRVWERGAGETQACGTGACAAAVAAIRQGWMDSPVQIELPGGRLSIEWAGPGQPVMMTGPAVRVLKDRFAYDRPDPGQHSATRRRSRRRLPARPSGVLRRPRRADPGIAHPTPAGHRRVAGGAPGRCASATSRCAIACRS